MRKGSERVNAMSKYDRNSALTAKLHAMYGKRLTPQGYEELLHKQSVAELASCIRQQPPYDGLLSGIDENGIYRSQLESLLRSQVFFDYLKLFRYVDGDEVAFLDLFLRRMEIEEILGCVRSLAAGQPYRGACPDPAQYARLFCFDPQRLAEVNSYGALLSILEKTPYAKLLRAFDPGGRDGLPIPAIEYALEKNYYAGVMKFIREKFLGEPRKLLLDAFGTEIDLANISRIIRLKRYFHAASPQIRALQFPFPHGIRKKELERMIEAPDAEAALQVLARTRYFRRFAEFGCDEVEFYAQKILFGLYLSMLRFSESSAVAVVAYLRLRQMEIDNIIRIIEGIHYGTAPQALANELVGIDVSFSSCGVTR